LKKVTLSRGRRKKSPIICRIDNASPASDHPIGVERITDIQLIRPKEYQPVAAFGYLEKAGIFKSTEGKGMGDRNHVRRRTQGADKRSPAGSSANHSLLG
jgi:hypothetical protein